MMAIEQKATAASEYSAWFGADHISRQRQTVLEKSRMKSALDQQGSAGVIDVPADTVELSHEVQSLAKMVGVMEMLLPH